MELQFSVGLLMEGKQIDKVVVQFNAKKAAAH
jgi:hypothetical protein